MAKFPIKGGRFLSAPKITKATGPTINRGGGNNNASTPMVFIRPVEAKFGKLEWDLAASNNNAKAPYYLSETDNALTYSWHALWKDHPLCWLNPPFTNITPWARKCAEECQLGARILLLVPASVGANWYWDWVVPYADVYSVGRMVFDDCYDKHGELITTVYPKDLVLAHYEWHGELKTGNHWLRTHDDEEPVGLIHRWRWQDGG